MLSWQLISANSVHINLNLLKTAQLSSFYGKSAAHPRGLKFTDGRGRRKRKVQGPAGSESITSWSRGVCSATALQLLPSMPALVRPRHSRWLKVISPFNKCFLFWPWPRGKLWVVMSPVATRSLLSPARKVISTHVSVPSNSCQARISRLRDQLERESSFGTSRFAGLHRTWTFELSLKKIDISFCVSKRRRRPGWCRRRGCGWSTCSRRPCPS